MLQGQSNPPESFSVVEVWNMSILDQLTSIYGRLNRLRYLGISVLFFIITFCYALIVGIIVGIVMAILDLPWLLFDLAIGALLIPVWYCSYAITVKRLQDMNWRDGWTTYLQVYLLLSAALGFAPSVSSLFFILDMLTIVLGIPLIVTIFAAGERGPNKFGPDPLSFQ
tara:strand:+ start:190 stop:693 length:504 start_codon:yes stop_codon:yes gene_type:complete